MTTEEKELEAHYKYVDEIKRQLADIYLFKAERDPKNTVVRILEPIPNGDYPMVINGVSDNIVIIDGNIFPYNFIS